MEIGFRCGSFRKKKIRENVFYMVLCCEMETNIYSFSFVAENRSSLFWIDDFQFSFRFLPVNLRFFFTYEIFNNFLSNNKTFEKLAKGF